MKYQVWGLAAPPAHAVNRPTAAEVHSCRRSTQQLSVTALSASAKLRLLLGLTALVTMPKA